MSTHRHTETEEKKKEEGKTESDIVKFLIILLIAEFKIP